MDLRIRREWISRPPVQRRHDTWLMLRHAVAMPRKARGRHATSIACPTGCSAKNGDGSGRSGKASCLAQYRSALRDAHVPEAVVFVFATRRHSLSSRIEQPGIPPAHAARCPAGLALCVKGSRGPACPTVQSKTQLPRRPASARLLWVHTTPKAFTRCGWIRLADSPRAQDRCFWCWRCSDWCFTCWSV